MNSFVRQGFALPTVLLASIVMMIVLMTSLVASSGVRSMLDEQHYTQMARLAAESGAIYAQDCMRQNNYQVTWSGRDLLPNRPCSGVTLASPAPSIYLYEVPGQYRVTYTVADMPDDASENIISVTGITEVLRSRSDGVRATHTHRLHAQISSDSDSERISFGYRWQGALDSSQGVHYGALASDGSVYTVGNNSSGQLGDGSTSNSIQPRRYNLPTGVTASRVISNFQSAGMGIYTITTDGRLYGSGDNISGMLTGSIGNVTTPRQVVFPTAAGVGTTNKVIGVENLPAALFAVLSNGDIYSAGLCLSGQLGHGTSCAGSRNPIGMQRVALPAGQRATDTIAAKTQTAYVITESGRVYGWGHNSHGQLGTSVSIGGAVTTPVRIGTFGSSTSTRAAKISTDGRTLYVVTQGGQLYALGDNSLLQIDAFASAMITSPMLISVSRAGCSGSVVDARIDRGHVAVLTSTGMVCTAGYNASGELGRGSTTSPLPLGRATLPDSGVRATAIWVNSLQNDNFGRANNTYVVGSNGAVYGTGSNYYGQLGNGRTFNSTTLTKMAVFGDGRGEVPAKSVRSGLGTTVIQAASGRVYAVGNNSHGQLGDGRTSNRTVPYAGRYLNLMPPIHY